MNRYHRIAIALVAALVVVPAFAATTVTVTGAAAIQGSFGMQVNYDGAGGAAYVQDNSPNAETVYFASWRMDPSNVTGMAELTTQQIFRGFINDDASGTPNTAFRVNLFKNLNSNPTSPYAIHVFPMLDTNVFFAPRIAVNAQTGAKHFTVEFRQGDGSANGIMRVYRDGVLRKEQLGLDNDNITVGMVRFGAPAAGQAATGGALYLDDFISTRTPQF